MEVQKQEAGAAPLELLRIWILAVLVLGLLGTITELILLEHYEEPLQFVLLILITLALVTVIWHLARRGVTSLNALMGLMGLFVIAGVVGCIAHFYGSAEFQLDLDPQMSTWELIDKVLRAKAPPLLAPGMMIQLGLLGLAYVLSDLRYRSSFRFMASKEW
jgi:hypothetical protein